MGETIRQTGNEAVKRWQERMPRFFQRIVILCAIVVVTAFTVNTALTVAGAEPHDWWRDAYPLLIGVPIGMIVICKLTVAGGYRDIDLDPLSHGQVDRGQRPAPSAHSPNMSDVDALSSDGTVFGDGRVTAAPLPAAARNAAAPVAAAGRVVAGSPSDIGASGDADDEPHEIEPYDDGPDA